MPLREIAVVLERQNDARAVGAILDTHLRRRENGLTDARRELDAVRLVIATESVTRPRTCRITMIGRDVAADHLAARVGPHVAGAHTGTRIPRLPDAAAPCPLGRTSGRRNHAPCSGHRCPDAHHASGTGLH